MRHFRLILYFRHSFTVPWFEVLILTAISFRRRLPFTLLLLHVNSIQDFQEKSLKIIFQVFQIVETVIKKTTTYVDVYLKPTDGSQKETMTIIPLSP